jgi:hypothetical protein
MDGAIPLFECARVPLRDGAAWGDMWRVHDDFSNRGAEWAGVSRAPWSVPCTVGGTETLCNVFGMLATLTRCPLLVSLRWDLS